MFGLGRRFIFGFCLAASLLVSGQALAVDFAFSPGGLSQAIFNSDAQLESITGTSNAVTGTISTDLAAPSSTTGTISIDASSFTTGIPTRDEHLVSENWIDAAANPQITFELTGVTVPEGATLEHATPVTATVLGNLTFHGETKPVSATAEVTYYELPEEQRNPQMGLSNNVVRVEATFDITLADYGISVPAPLELKVAETISLQLRLTGVQQ
ncbi:MAG: YceI family protein [Myxococcales bacterium]|nr:YceI family protein [Myxococcales bacterium]